MKKRITEVLYHMVARPVFLVAILFFGMFATQSLIRGYETILTTNATGEEKGYVIGKSIGIVLIAALLSAIITRFSWREFKSGTFRHSDRLPKTKQAAPVEMTNG